MIKSYKTLNLQGDSIIIELYEKAKGVIPADVWTLHCKDKPAYTPFGQNALAQCRLCLVARNTQRDVMGFVLVLDHTFLTELYDPEHPKPVCKAHEWYIDVICASTGYGAFLVEVVYKHALFAGKTAIRLYSTNAAFEYWSKKHQYKQVDDPCRDPNAPPRRKGYPAEADDPEEEQSLRMTRCLLEGAFHEKMRKAAQGTTRSKGGLNLADIKNYWPTKTKALKRTEYNKRLEKLVDKLDGWKKQPKKRHRRTPSHSRRTRR
jgi:hypothetical protein